MISKAHILFLILLFAAPSAGRADVIINEVAWMGTDEGGVNCEWIELRNSEDEVVDLSAWTLTIRNAGATTEKAIALNETASVKYSGVAANGFYLIARDSGSCKDSAPGKDADWVGSFGNGIGNSGALITLKNAGTKEDEVDATAGWEASKGGPGGKNTAPKETPQRGGGSWITAGPTPRGPNRTAPLEEIDEPEDDDTPPVVTVGGTAPLVPVTNPVPDLYVEGGPARIVLAGADTVFSAIAYDSVGTIRKNADITWSFGDGGHKKGDEVAYAYRHPGDYTVVVRAKDKGISAIALIPIVVAEGAVAITDAADEGITLTNSSDQLVDLSGWKIGGERKTIKLPPDTIIAAGDSVFFPFEVLRISSSTDLALKFPNGKIAHTYTQPTAGEAGLYGVQDVEPAHSLATRKGTTYANADFAPATHAPRVVAGAAVSVPETLPRKVLLKEESSFDFGTLFASVAASVISFIIP